MACRELQPPESRPFAIDPLWGVLFPPREAEKSSAATGLPLCADALSSTMIEASRLSPNARRHTPHRPLDAPADPQSNLSAGRNAAARGDRLDCRAVAAVAARRSSRERMERVERVVATLNDASFPFTENVLTKMRGLSGAEYAALRRARRHRHLHARHVGRAADLPAPARHRSAHSPGRLSGDRRRRASLLPGCIERSRQRGRAFAVGALPKSNLWQAQWAAAWPPLAIGGVAILLMVAVSAWLSQRAGAADRGRAGIVRSVGRRSFRPRRRTAATRRNLRSHLVGQSPLRPPGLQPGRNRPHRTLASTRAAGRRPVHQLRNSVTGARMAVQLHQRRCPRQHDESLDVALRQLSLTEEQVRGFLSLGKPEQQPPVAQPLSRIVAEVDRLVAPAARHGHVAWECEPPAADDDPIVANAQRAGRALEPRAQRRASRRQRRRRNPPVAAAVRNRPATADASGCRPSGSDATCRFTSPIQGAVRPSRCARRCSSLLSRPSRKASAWGSRWRKRPPKSTAAA